MLEIRHLRYFLAVAEELHFGRAAKRLHISQPPLSKRISELERQLDVRLFHRLPTGVVLTDQGRAFLPYAQDALESVLKAESVLRRHSSERVGRIRIAFPPDTSAGLVATVSRGMWENGCDIEVLEASTAQQLDMLRTGAIDVGLVRHPYSAKQAVSSPALYKPLGVAVSRDHPIASRTTVDLADLAGQPLLIFPRDLAPDLHDSMLGACRKHGFVPQRIRYAARLVDALLVLEKSVMLTSAEATSLWPDVVWVPLTGEPLEWRTSVVVSDRPTGNDMLERTAALILEALVAQEGWRHLPSTPGLAPGAVEAPRPGAPTG
ncbi:LysR family transcriptional regulator [Blastococcus saxobsidens]|uniref:Transcriptional regulator, LysR family n=1 Tax=Blastococcus saxobsidens (strain DD2) TaxID=1146883 RepID=H6RSX9_BLASD|nr:LysR family transcriptional regulator [Blastococcus saxobsidens]CCG04282.1 Transcriptional regulator, LysR family [Blastococcus saxobsidens DD2]